MSLLVPSDSLTLMANLRMQWIYVDFMEMFQFLKDFPRHLPSLQLVYVGPAMTTWLVSVCDGTQPNPSTKHVTFIIRWSGHDYLTCLSLWRHST